VGAPRQVRVSGADIIRPGGGNNPGQYTEWVRIDNPGLASIVIEDLVPGTWEFAMTSFNVAGVESSLSNAVTRFVG